MNQDTLARLNAVTDGGWRYDVQGGHYLYGSWGSDGLIRITCREMQDGKWKAESSSPCYAETFRQKTPERAVELVFEEIVQYIEGLQEALPEAYRNE